MSATPILEAPPAKVELLKPPGASLFRKLAEITAEIGHIEARGFHSFYKTRYVTEEDLVDAVRTKLVAKHVVMLPSVVGYDGRAGKTAKGKDTYITTVRVAFEFCDGETGETHRCEWIGAGEDLGSDGANKAITSALRTFLLKGFLVPTGDQEPIVESAPPPPRADGQNALTREQYDGIVAAFHEAHADEKHLHEILDTHKVPRDVEGQSLSVSQRVQLLGAVDAIQVQKDLMAMVPA